MRHGSFPGQEEALRARSAELQASAGKATRRMFLGMGLGGVLGAVTGTVVTRIVGGAGSAEPVTKSPEVQNLDPATQSLRDLAKGPLEELLRRQVTYLWQVIEARHVDDVMWGGVIRIANAVIERDPRIRTGTARAILLLERNGEIPTYMRLWLDLVREVR